jgi:hypothetical protein
VLIANDAPEGMTRVFTTENKVEEAVNAPSYLALAIDPAEKRPIAAT